MSLYKSSISPSHVKDCVTKDVIKLKKKTIMREAYIMKHFPALPKYFNKPLLFKKVAKIQIRLKTN